MQAGRSRVHAAHIIVHQLDAAEQGGEQQIVSPPQHIQTAQPGISGVQTFHLTLPKALCQNIRNGYHRPAAQGVYQDRGG